MASKNLLVNEEKTEYTTLQKEDQKIRRGKREWRLVIKLGSKLGDWEQW